MGGTAFRTVWQRKASSTRAPAARELAAPSPSSSLCLSLAPSCLPPKSSKSGSKRHLAYAIVPGVGLSQLTALRCTLPTPHAHALPVHSTHTATLSHTQRQPVLHASFDIHSSPSQMHHGVGDTLTHAYTHTHTHTQTHTHRHTAIHPKF